MLKRDLRYLVSESWGIEKLSWELLIFSRRYVSLNNIILFLVIGFVVCKMFLYFICIVIGRE